MRTGPSITCNVCGEVIVIAEDDYGTTLEDLVEIAIGGGWSSDSDDLDYCPEHAELNPESGHFSEEMLESYRDRQALRGFYL